MVNRAGYALAIHVSVAAFVASALLGAWAAYDRALSGSQLAAVLVGGLLYLSLARARRPEALTAAGAFVTLAGALAALYFIAQYGHQAYTVKSGLIARLGQATTFLPNLNGPPLHPNVLASYLAGALPVGGAMWSASRTRPARAGWLAVGLLMAYALLLSASRGAWLAMGVTAGVYAGLRFQRLAWRVVGLGAALCAAGGLALLGLGGDPRQWALVASVAPAALQRLGLYQNSLRLAQDYFFTGLGLGDTFGQVYARYSQLSLSTSVGHAHNLPLAIWLNQGLLGLLAFLALTLGGAAFIFQTRRRGAPGALFEGAWLGVTALWLHGLTDAPQYSGSLPMFLAVWGLTVAAGSAAPAPPTAGARPPVPLSRYGWAVAVLLIVGVTAGLGVGRRPILAAWYTNWGALAETRADLTPALTAAERAAAAAEAEVWYRRALAEEPAWPGANRRLGNLLVAHGDFAAALAPLETALRAEPHYLATVKGLGLAYTWVGRTETAAVMFHQLDDPAGMEQELYTWGYYRAEQGRPLLTAYAWETAQRMYPERPNLDVWLLIAEKYRAAGELEAARRVYHQVLTLEPDQPQALSALAELGP